MAIIELPVSRLRGDFADRAALRSGLAVPRPRVRVVSALDQVTERGYFCDRCAAPVEFGAVMNGRGTFCSVECSLGGPNRPA